MFADSLAKVLGGQTLVVERAARAQGAATARVLAPDLIVLAGDAANDRGAAVIAQLAQNSRESTGLPVLVICAPELGGLTPQTAPPRHVGFLSPEGGMGECARRVQAVVQLFVDEGLASCSLQQLVDTVAPPVAKTATSTAKLPTQTKPASIRSAIASAKGNTALGLPKVTPATAAAAVEPAKQAAPPAAASAPTPKPSTAAFPAAKPQPAPAKQPSAAEPASKQASTSAFAAVKAPERAEAAKPASTAQLPAAQPAKKASTTAFAAVAPAAAKQPAAATPAVQPKAAEPAAPRPAAAAPAAQPQLSPEPAPAAAKPPVAARAASTAKQPVAAAPSAEAQPSAEPAPAPAKRPTTATATPAAAPQPAAAAERARSAPKQSSTTAFGAVKPAAAPPRAEPAAKQASTTAFAAVQPEAKSPAAAPVLASQASVAERAPEPSIAKPTKSEPAQRVTPVPSEPAPLALTPIPSEPAPLALTPIPSEPAQAMTLSEPAAVSDHAALIVDDTSDESDVEPTIVAPLRDLLASIAQQQPSEPEAEVVLSLSQQPTADMPAVVHSAPPPLRRSKNAEPAQEVIVSFSDPAPSAAPEPAPAPKPQPAAAPKPQPQLAAAPEPQPQLAPQPQVSAPPTLPRAKRRAANPLAAAQWQPPASAAATWNTAPDPTPARSRRNPLWYAAAAIGCAAIVLGWLYLNGGGQRKGGAAALGALQQAGVVTPTVESPLAPSQEAPTPYASATPSPSPSPSGALPAPAAQNPTAAQDTTLAAGPASRGGRTGEPAPAADSGSDTDRAKALVDEGNALLKKGRLGLAESSYQKAMQLVPEYPTAMASLVRVHLVRKDGAEAVRWAKRLVQLQPSNGGYQLLLGDAQALYGDGDAARDAWTAAANSGNSVARSRLEEF